MEQVDEESSKSVSKKAAKKEAAKQEKLRRRQEAALASAAASLAIGEEEDPLAVNYGNVPLYELQSKEETDLSEWTRVGYLSEGLKDNKVLIRGRAQTTRAVGKNMAFVVVRQKGFTVQCVVTVQPDLVSRQMVKFVAGLSRESIIDVQGLVSVPSVPIKGTTQQVEVQVRKLHCISKAMPTLPINIEDAARSEKEIEEALQAGEQLVRVNQDTHLNYRVLDMRTPANQGIFHIQHEVGSNLLLVTLERERLREPDENQATSTPKDFIQGPITKARAKSLQNLICEILRSKDYKLEWHEENYKELNLVKIKLGSDQVSCGALGYME